MIVDAEKLYYIAHNGIDVFHVGEAEIGQEITTGQPFLETFENIADYESRLIDLNINIEQVSNG